ncbi:methyltransferase domain-containing protein [Ornithobacterium rhinotracheale]|uniref:Methyltransferase domain-containing protein n=2 Tax=Ornithobacterium rhinotracheale TaxID=28251 RepID=A0A3R5Y1Z7_ORNRH|nr:methyltransferase domain-containing protein [Ornithobacterium rhinotracheale]
MESFFMPKSLFTTMSQIFRFKQFSVEQAGAAAKIGTDAVLLGAWCPLLPSFQHSLDIGTGVIALMLAQRGAQQIDAIELDASAYQTAKNNFKHSPWAARLQIYNADFLDFSWDKKYDLVMREVKCNLN